MSSSSSLTSPLDLDMDLLQLADNKKAHIHPHVQCDLCKVGPIVGIRFKCSMCDNYDECESCVRDVKKSHFGSMAFFDVEKCRKSFHICLYNM